MNKYKKKPLYLEVDDKVLEPFLVKGNSMIKYCKQVKLKYRQIEVNGDIWLYAEKKGLNAKDLEKLGLNTMTDFFEAVITSKKGFTAQLNKLSIKQAVDLVEYAQEENCTSKLFTNLLKTKIQ
jgi:hypothetical protein